MVIASDFVNRDAERELFRSMFQRENSARVIDIRAGEGTGKTWLLRYLKRDAADAKIPVALIDFETWKPDDPIEFMRKLVDELNRSAHVGSFMSFCSQDAVLHGQPLYNNSFDVPSQVTMEGDFAGATVRNVSGRDMYDITNNQYRPPTKAEMRRIEQVLTQHFCSDLRILVSGSAAAVLLDGMEHIPNHISDWLVRNLLPDLRDGVTESLVLVMAGRPGGLRPVFELHERGKWIVVHEELSPFSPYHTESYLTQRNIHLEMAILETIHQATKQNPLALALLAQGLSKER